jgi:Tfp pilus assembly protein PilE
MRKVTSDQKGFSAVELLITLFIAVAFIATGYQLYTIIIKDGGEARMRARASNIAYDNLRRYTPQATDPCSVFTPTPAPSIPSGSGLSNASITITVTCPYTTTLNITKVQVSVKYGSPQQEVVHAILVN